MRYKYKAYNAQSETAWVTEEHDTLAEAVEAAKQLGLDALPQAQGQIVVFRADQDLSDCAEAKDFYRRY